MKKAFYRFFSNQFTIQLFLVQSYFRAIIRKMIIKLFITGPTFIQIFMCKINIKNYRVENFLLSSTTLLIEVALYSFRNSHSFILKAGKKYFFLLPFIGDMLNHIDGEIKIIAHTYQSTLL